MTKDELNLNKDIKFFNEIIQYFYSINTFKLGVNLLLNHFKIFQSCEITYDGDYEDSNYISVNIKPKIHKNFYIFNYIDFHLNKTAGKLVINNNHSLYISSEYVINRLRISLIENDTL